MNADALRRRIRNANRALDRAIARRARRDEIQARLIALQNAEDALALYCAGAR